MTTSAAGPSTRYRVRRIVHVYLRPASFSTGGVNRAAQQWAARMADHTGLPTVYVQAAGGFEGRLVEAPGLEHRTLATLGGGRQTMLPRGLGRLLQAGDLVYLHEGWTPSNLVIAAWCRRRRIPYVVMPHGVYERSIVQASSLLRPRTWLERPTLERAAGVHLYFASERAHLADVAPRARAFAAPTGRAVQDGPLVADRHPYVAWLGRYDIRHKGIDVLLDGVASLPEEQRPQLRMVGQDHLGDRARVRDRVAQQGLAPWVTVEDELPHEEAGRFLGEARAFVHTPRWECLPTTVLEALERGTPTLLTDTAHVAGLLGDAGLVTVVPLEPAAIGEALHAAAAAADDPAAAQRRRAGLAESLAWERSLGDWAAALAAAGIDLPRRLGDSGAAPLVGDRRGTEEDAG
ncbi:Glycosyltransferase involved in cell wall bisynthesis [Klenkia soli]|uniref:Glycosyltransferase involved in cell wall bisynthesis n=1 Tax=Klenkia soli TaxID=1052260 RepID=A0A1H0MTW6_9ACTN|nr:glycosyltransferase [Klenkia soli]SDO83812.1 Glycosyltransferase involved in cell wall bisynthesis [Klenkia soli]